VDYSNSIEITSNSKIIAKAQSQMHRNGFTGYLQKGLF